MRHRIRVCYLKSAFLQVLTEIKDRSADEECALGIDHHPHVGCLHQDITVGWPIDQIHLVLQSRAATADDSDTQGAIRSSLLLQQ